MTETADSASTTTEAIERRLELRASPERVWRALTDSDELAAWFSQRADLTPEPGREGWLEWDGHGRFAVRVEVAEAPTRLAWRWMNGPDAAIDAGSTLVEWRLEPTADGGTVLYLRESGFAGPSNRTDNAVGWLQELAELVAFVAVEPWDAGIRRTYVFGASPEHVWQAFADPAQFSVWFGGTDPVELVAGTDGGFVWPSEGGRFAVRIEAVEPPTYLAWRWSATPDVALEDSGQVLRTEWAFERREDGGTNLHLLETGFRGPKDVKLNSDGWDGDVLAALRRVLGEAEA